jgi:hypothetical protein
MQKYQNTDRNEFALATVQACRTLRANPKIQSAQYFWVDVGNTIAIVTQGEPGCFDFDPEGNPEISKAMFALHDMGTMVSNETWSDAARGQKTWAESGSPSGIS